MELLDSYATALLSLAAIASVMLLQILIADVVSIKQRHTPGTPVISGHDDLLFRVSRTVANTNESIAIFICALLYCVATEASPQYTAYAAWSYVVLRVLYALCYYTNQQTLRSISFGLSLLALVSLLVVGVFT